jgi:hypothetical protein
MITAASFDSLRDLTRASGRALPLFRNPTNLHTHGLIVPARAATPGDPTFGDYVFVQVYNSTNGMPEP